MRKAKNVKSIFKKEHSKHKQLTRTFRLNISNSLMYCKKWARDVVREIENDRLLVIDADEVFSHDIQGDGSLFLDSCYKNPVSIKEWLPVACQSIRQQGGDLDNFNRPAMACYKSNAGEVLFPCGADDMPPGPVAFHGAIVFGSDFILSISDDPKGEDKFKFVLAHELVHVFNFMRLLVPAFRNWKRFWKICLDKGCVIDDISQHWSYSNIFIDSYGEESELLMVSEYWPKKAGKWFDAFRQ